MVKKKKDEIIVNNNEKGKKIEIEINEIGKKIKDSKKISTLEKEILKRKIFLMLFITGIVMFVFMFVLIGYDNIALENYLVDLKVFSIIAIMITIFIFEYAYKRDSGKFAIIGIESLVASFVMLSLYYVLEFKIYPFRTYLLIMVSTFIGYYFLKIFIIFSKDLHKYKKNANDIKKIIKKEEI